MQRRVLGPVVILISAALIAAGCGDDGGGDDAVPVDDAVVSDVVTDEPDVDDVEPEDPGIGPPTTRGPAPSADVDPLGELGSRGVLNGEPPYRGALGQIDPDRVVVDPVALPPEPVAGVAPLTGLPAELDRPALLVKLDNTDSGRPQESLALADLVYEEMIEGGFTRLAAVYHTHAPELGPIRSGRTTDIALLGSLDTPIFAWSGANLVHAALLREHSMVDLGAQTRSEYFRADDRPGTYDLMSQADELFAIAESNGDGGTPPPHFEYRNDEVGLPDSAEPAASVRVSFPSVTADWAWDDATGAWLRTQGGTPHLDAQEIQVAAANVVVAEVPQVATGSVDTSGATVFEQQFLGSGRGWVFTDGHVVEVTWTKPSISSVATWTTPDGIPVALTPGITWIELAPIAATTIS